MKNNYKYIHRKTYLSLTYHNEHKNDKRKFNTNGTESFLDPSIKSGQKWYVLEFFFIRLNFIISSASMLQYFTVYQGKDTLWNFSFREFHEIQFQSHFMKHKILSWNTFTLVSNIHYVCFSSIKKCVWREKIPCKI